MDCKDCEGYGLCDMLLETPDDCPIFRLKGASRRDWSIQGQSSRPCSGFYVYQSGNRARFARMLINLIGERTFNEMSELTGIAAIRLSQYCRQIMDRPMQPAEMKALLTDCSEELKEEFYLAAGYVRSLQK